MHISQPIKTAPSAHNGLVCGRAKPATVVLSSAQGKITKCSQQNVQSVSAKTPATHEVAPSFVGIAG